MTRRFRSHLVALCLAAMMMTLGLAGVARAQDATPATSASPVADSTFQITGLVNTPMTLSASDLSQFAAQSADVSFGSGSGPQTHHYDGVLLSDVIAKAGLKTDANVKNDALHFYLVITANDGYQTVISWGEIDPSFGNNPYLLATMQDGQPLTGTDGPVRLVTPGDVKGGRYVTGVVSIDVRSTDAAS